MVPNPNQVQRYLHAARHLSACHLGDATSGLGRFGFRLFEVGVRVGVRVRDRVRVRVRVRVVVRVRWSQSPFFSRPLRLPPLEVRSP